MTKNGSEVSHNLVEDDLLRYVSALSGTLGRASRGRQGVDSGRGVILDTVLAWNKALIGPEVQIHKNYSRKSPSSTLQ